MLDGRDVLMINDLHRQGVSIQELARTFGHDRKTVRKYLKLGLEPPVDNPRGATRRRAGAVEGRQPRAVRRDGGPERGQALAADSRTRLSRRRDDREGLRAPGPPAGGADLRAPLQDRARRVAAKIE